jgi:hypothetical protein
LTHITQITANIYIVDQDLGNCILSIEDNIDVCIEESCIENKKEKEKIK